MSESTSAPAERGAAEAASAGTVRRRRGRSRERRHALLEAARRAIRAIGPDVSLEQIAAEAGVSRPILYRHFGDRQGMAQAVADDAITRALAGTGQQVVDGRVPTRASVRGVGDTLRRLLADYLDFVDADPELYRFVLRERAFRSVGPAGDVGAGPLGIIVLPLVVALEREGAGRAAATLRATAVAGMLAATVSAEIERPGWDRPTLESTLLDLAMRICGPDRREGRS